MFLSALSASLFWVASLSASPSVVPTPNSTVEAPVGADIDSLRIQFPQARIVLAADGRSPRTIAGIRVSTVGESARGRAEHFLSRYGRMTGATAFRYTGQSESRDLTTVRFEQLHDGIPVVDRNLVVRLDKDGFVRGIVSDFSLSLIHI